MTSFQAPTGTRDVLAPESARVERLVATFAGAARRAGYGLVISPMFEDVGVFSRGIGEGSDVVAKEMYEFEDKGGRRLALRPEGTASVVRAFVQHRPTVPWKAWYVTPAFRYERPQAGRYRQHHQLGVEAIGSDDADLDVEVISLLGEYLAAVGLRKVRLRVNSMGDASCRPAYAASLGAYLEAHAGELCGEHALSWAANPLRVLDCKRSECVSVRAGAPRLVDALCDACRVHFARVREGLGAVGMAFESDDFLVRGFDYYTRTTFEFVADGLDAAQNAVGGGGRYNGLVEALGGPPTAGIGFGTGIERVLLALDALGAEQAVGGVDVFVVDLVDGSFARDLTTELRRRNIACDRGFDGRSLKAQMRLADRSGARIALIVGGDEAAAGEVSMRLLRGPDHDQERVARADLVTRLEQVLA